MADAILTGRKKSQKENPLCQYLFFNRSYEKAQKFAKKFGGKSIKQLPLIKEDQKLEAIFLLVKPQNFLDLAEELVPFLKRYHTNHPNVAIISFMAAVQSPLLSEVLKVPLSSIFRIMPHMGVAHGLGSSYLFHALLPSSVESKVSKTTLSLMSRFWSPLGGLHFTTNEKIIDDGVAILGSAPALLATLIMSLADAHPPTLIPDSQKFQILSECLKLLCEWQTSGQSWEELVKKVSSAKGVTQAAIEKWNSLNLPKIVKEGIDRMHQRTKEMAEEIQALRDRKKTMQILK